MFKIIGVFLILFLHFLLIGQHEAEISRTLIFRKESAVPLKGEIVFTDKIKEAKTNAIVPIEWKKWKNIVDSVYH